MTLLLTGFCWIKPPRQCNYINRCSRGQVFSELARRCRAGTECEDPIPHDGGDGNRNVHLDDNSQNDSDQEARNTNRNEEHPMICESGAKRHQTKCFKVRIIKKFDSFEAFT